MMKTEDLESVDQGEFARRFREDMARMRQESEIAGREGITALRRIARQVIGHDNGQALRIRQLLLSIFGKVKVSLVEVNYLDWGLRKDFVAVLLGVDQIGFPDYKIRDVLIEEGDSGASWFFGGVTDEDGDNSGSE